MAADVGQLGGVVGAAEILVHLASVNHLQDVVRAGRVVSEHAEEFEIGRLVVEDEDHGALGSIGGCDFDGLFQNVGDLGDLDKLALAGRVVSGCVQDEMGNRGDRGTDSATPTRNRSTQHDLEHGWNLGPSGSP